MSPTPRAALLLALAAATALLLPPPISALVAGAVLAASLGDAWLARHRPVVERRLPGTLSRGVPAPFVLRPKSASERLRLRQPVPPDLRLEPQEADGRLDGQIVALRRGRHVLPPAGTRVTGPLGLGCFYHRTGELAEVIVFPDLLAAQRFRLAVRFGRFHEEGRRTRGPLGLGTDLERIREYSPDDDIRQVNWRATARRGTPMSNQWRVERERELICLVDCGRLMAAPIGDRTRLDAAVDAVAAMAGVADELGDRIGVVAFDGRVRRQLHPRRAGGEAVVAAVFDLEPSAEDSDYALAFQTVAAAKRAFILILTDILEEAAARPLTEAMGILSRHHAVAVASVLDDDLRAAVRTPAESVAEVYRTVAALTVLEARAKVAAALRHAGAEVIEAPLASLSSHCVGAYLRARAQARW